MGKNYTDSNGTKLISTTRIACFISIIPCIITFSFYPLIIIVIAPIIDFLIEKKILGQYDENGVLILGRDDEGNPIRSTNAAINTKTANVETQIKQAYGLHVKSGNSPPQFPNEWLVSMIGVILTAPTASIFFVQYLDTPPWWPAWWLSLLMSLSDYLWSLIL